MKVIGITGGVGSGKSRVLSYIEAQYDAVICQADHVAWGLQEPGQTCYLEIVKAFGTEILDEDKTINRGKLGQIVFGDSEKLILLNQIMHPAVKRHIINWIASERKKKTAYFFLEAALLLEEHYSQICDELWYIYADEDVRRIRLKESRQYSDERITAIMNAQLPETTFREHCQFVIDNSGDFGHTCYQIEERMKR